MIQNMKLFFKVEKTGSGTCKQNGAKFHNYNCVSNTQNTGVCSRNFYFKISLCQSKMKSTCTPKRKVHKIFVKQNKT